MKRSGNRRTRKRRGGSSCEMKGTLARHLQVQQISLVPLQLQQSNSTNAKSSRFQNLLDCESAEPRLNASVSAGDGVVDVEDKEFILSQDFFW